MFIKVNTAAIVGVRGYPVAVEIDIQRGMPVFNIVGLADTTIKEAYRRIKPAVKNSGYNFPVEKVTVNLVPADRPKEGSHFDLPIAVGIIMLGEIAADVKDTGFFGELSLDGKVNPVKGILPLVMAMRNTGIKKVIVPRENADEAGVLTDIEVLPADSLEQVAEHITGLNIIEPHVREETSQKPSANIDYGQVFGQEYAKRAMTIAAAGNHGLLMMGEPGCGKTMMAKRLPTILPPLTYDEKIEITGIYSVAGLISGKEGMLKERPFRSPHHTVTVSGLIGGGAKPRPGELSLAHRGVLFLDELGEFQHRVIDVMRQPIEDGIIRLRRNNEEVIFPSQVMVVIAANPCKCGNLWSDKRMCTCTKSQINSYRRKILGPFADRIDMHVKMRPVENMALRKPSDLSKESCCMNSAVMREIVIKCRELQKDRYKGTEYTANGNLDEKGISLYCKLSDNATEMMSKAYEKLDLTMRGYSRILKVARTVADIDDREIIEEEHVAEALSYRLSSDFYKG